MIRGDDEHSIKITQVNVTMVGEDTTVYKVIKTREKYRMSGVYEKSIADEEYNETDTVSPGFYRKN